jgi:pre-mRNA-processing factor 40
LSSSWKEYETNGRKYWHNTETNQTTWDMPDVLKSAQQSQPQPQSQSQASTQLVKQSAPYVTSDHKYIVTNLKRTFVSAGASSFQDNYRQRDDYDRPISYGTSAITQDQEYSSLDEAEAVFHKVLRKNGVQPDWTWEQTIRACVKDPQYRAVKDPKDRKLSFEKYVAEVRAQEKDREKDRQAKLRTDFYTMLRSHPEIRYYTRWSTALETIQGETIFRSAKSEQEAHNLFLEYRADLHKKHLDQESGMRKSALDQLIHLLQSLDLEPYTKWSEAQELLHSSSRFQGDEAFKSLTKIDILKAFENHVKLLERSFSDKRQKEKSLKARQERKNREGFISLLNQLRSAGKINAGTKWMDVQDLIQDDPRYVAMLGQSGSSPLDLFWDMIEEEERSLKNKRNDALDVLEVRETPSLHILQLLTFAGKTIRTNSENNFRKLHRYHVC